MGAKYTHVLQNHMQKDRKKRKRKRKKEKEKYI